MQEISAEPTKERSTPRDYSALEFLIALEFPLIKLIFMDKRPVLGEKWAGEIEHRKRPVEFFLGHNWGVKCGTKMFGGWLTVIDVDKKNGGLESFKLLLAAFGDFTKTMYVSSSEGSFHLYFVANRPVKSFLLAKGVEVKGLGSLVVGPGSVHKSGKTYELVIAEEPSELPDFVYEKEAEQNSGDDWVNTEKDSEDRKYGEGERHKFMLRKAGQLRFAGLDEKEILRGLEFFNQKNCDPLLPIEEIRRIATDYGKKTTEEEKEQAKYPKAEPRSQPQKKVYDLEAIGELNRLYKLAPPLLRDLADEILTTAKRPYPHFAMASALSIVSGVAQGCYGVPNFSNSSLIDDSVSLYQIITAGSGAGKEAYLSAVERYLTAVDPRLVSPKAGSSLGVRSFLYVFNTRTMIMDELQDELARIGNNTNSYVAQVLTDLKEIFNAKNSLTSSATKGHCFPTVYLPRVSFFGAGTALGYKKLLSDKFLTGGLVARMIAYPEPELNPDEFNEGAKVGLDPSERLVKALREIMVPFFNHEAEQDEAKAWEAIAKINEKGGYNVPAHVAQIGPSVPVGIDDEAKTIFRAYRRSCDLKTKRYIDDALGEDEVSPASVVARLPQMAKRFASIYALCSKPGGSTPRVNKDAAEWAVGWTQALGEAECRIISESTAKDNYEEAERKIIAFLKKHKGRNTRRKIYQGCRDLKRFYALPSLIQLVFSGRVDMWCGNEKKDVEDNVKDLPKGALFSLAE